MTRSDLEAEISAGLPRCGDDELRIVANMIRRLLGFKPEYGEFKAATDRRDMRDEAASEFADALFYMCAAEVIAAERRSFQRAAAQTPPAQSSEAGQPSRDEGDVSWAQGQRQVGASSTNNAPAVEAQEEPAPFDPSGPTWNPPAYSYGHGHLELPEHDACDCAECVAVKGSGK